MNICIFGGSGLVGNSLCKLIQEEGHNVTVVSRRNTANTDGVKHISCDLSEDSWLDALKGKLLEFEVFVYLSYSNTGNDDYNRRVTTDALTELFDYLLNNLPIKLKFIFLGSSTVFGQDIHGVITEKSDRNPDSAYSKNKYDAVRYLYDNNSDKIITVIQPTGVYSKDLSRIRNYQLILSRGYIHFLNDGSGYNNIVHAADVAGSIISALKSNNEAGIHEYVINGETIKYSDRFRIIGSRTEVKYPFRLPVYFKSICRGSIVRILNMIGFSVPVNIAGYKLRQFENIVEFDSSKAMQNLGFSPQYMTRDVFEGY